MQGEVDDAAFARLYVRSKWRQQKRGAGPLREVRRAAAQPPAPIQARVRLRSPTLGHLSPVTVDSASRAWCARVHVCARHATAALARDRAHQVLLPLRMQQLVRAGLALQLPLPLLRARRSWCARAWRARQWTPR